MKAIHLALAFETSALILLITHLVTREPHVFFFMVLYWIAGICVYAFNYFNKKDKKIKRIFPSEDEWERP